MSREIEELDEVVVEVVAKIEALPLLRRRDDTACSLALAILSARKAIEAGANEEDFIESCRNAWKLEVERG